MSLHEKGANELDDWFKKSLEEPDLPFDPDAWRAMEAKLAAASPARPRYRRWWLLAGLLLAGFTGWYSWHESAVGAEERRARPADGTTVARPPAMERPNGRTAITRVEDSTARPSQSLAPNRADARSGSIGTVPGRVLAEPEGEQRSLTKPSPWPVMPNAVRPGEPRAEALPKRISTERRPGRRKGNGLPPANAEGRARYPEASQGLAGSVGRETLVRGSVEPHERQERLAVNAWETLVLRSPTALNVPEDLLSMGRPVEVGSVPLDSALDSPTRKSGWRRWSVQLVLAPDLSTVGFTNFVMPGTSKGLTLEYRFSDQLSVVAGALYTTKRYYAGAEDYTPAGPWPYSPPERIDGTCQVIDLPINLRYNAWLGARFTAYASAGVSSYLMRRERYAYVYPARTTAWGVDGQNQHWLGVLNLSVGYERKLGGRVSVQVEPYLKLPLAGVGAGKVKLSSTGAFLALKYRLHR